MPIKCSDWKNQHGDTLPLFIILGGYSNRRAHIMIFSYRCYGVKKAFIRTYECMDERTDERTTETIIFDRGMRKYVRVNDYSFSGSFIRPFVHTLIRPYEGLFHSITYIRAYHNMCTSVRILPRVIHNGRVSPCCSFWSGHLIGKRKQPPQVQSICSGFDIAHKTNQS